jgi:hypothetical protein
MRPEAAVKRLAKSIDAYAEQMEEVASQHAFKHSFLGEHLGRLSAERRAQRLAREPEAGR